MGVGTTAFGFHVGKHEPRYDWLAGEKAALKQPQQKPGYLTESPLWARPAARYPARYVGDSAIPCHSNPVPSALARIFPLDQWHALAVSSQVATVLSLCQRLQLTQERGSLLMLRICVACGLVVCITISRHFHPRVPNRHRLRHLPVRLGSKN